MKLTKATFERNQRLKREELEQDRQRGKLALEEAEQYQQAEKNKVIKARKDAIQVEKFLKKQIISRHCELYEEEEDDLQYARSKQKEIDDLDEKIKQYTEGFLSGLEFGEQGQKIVTQHIYKMMGRK